MKRIILSAISVILLTVSITACTNTDKSKSFEDFIMIEDTQNSIMNLNGIISFMCHGELLEILY